ncbi:MauE/DoxX family redox-associated membrane protein [Priestia megaterium]|uniref:MauE/DoxX family redox-associated membrane protein n=1 Tax=Priestia megaterium TaxID=1404 RepID=UPI001A93AA84|nr:MauE/DoxX family redox-associated membrane protein [Priestia megaterium]QSX23449.1 DoxX family membrane protein [Priestia megaterium]
MNSELELFIRVFLAFIFISSAVSKYNNFDKHIGIISDYKILPSSFSRIAGRFDFTAELCVGILLLIGFLKPLAVSISVLLLLIYIVAVSINLLRGRKEISCGCGGILGNHQLSWKLVARNIFLVLTIISILLIKDSLFSFDTLIQTDSAIHTFGYKAWQYLFISTSLIIILLLAKETFHINKHFNKIISSLKNND